MKVCQYTQNGRLFVLSKDGNLAGVDSAEDNRCYGVEIELEGFVDKLIGTAIWNVTQDGSLRNGGMELVSVPFAYEALKLIGADLMGIIRHHPGAHASYRCGLHVHANALDFDEDNLRSLFMIYTAAEPIIWHVSGNRMNSEFCIPLVGCERFELFSDVLFDTKLTGSNFYDTLVNNAEKYQALNYAPLFRFGTVEFRHHRGTKDWAEITRWLTIIDCMMNMAKRIPSKDMFAKLSDINRVSTYMEFATELLKGTGIEVPPDVGQPLVRSGVRSLKVLRALAKHQ